MHWSACAILYRGLEHRGFCIHRESWKQRPADTEGQLKFGGVKVVRRFLTVVGRVVVVSISNTQVVQGSTVILIFRLDFFTIGEVKAPRPNHRGEQHD